MTDVRTFLMIGRPGAGKGTQAKLLAKKIQAEIYSSGNRLREMAKGHGFVAQKIGRIMEEGDLLPAWFSSHLFVEVLLGLQPEDAIVFEGACRRLLEARDFAEVAEWLERPYEAIFLSISDEEVEKRLTLRKNTEGRNDDASDTVLHRIAEYEQNTRPVVDFFRLQGTLTEINGEQTMEKVHQDILLALRSFGGVGGASIK
jgi:adenylate kinase